MEKNTIYKKIGSLRNKIDAVKKSNNNPFFKSKYADINTIERIVEPIEYEVGLTHFITSTIADDGSQLLTLTVADVESGETLTSTLKVILAKNDMQQLISGHTYGRRGLLVSFYSLESEDDDGNSVSNNYDNPAYENKPKPQQQKAGFNAIPKKIDEHQVKALLRLFTSDEHKNDFLATCKISKIEDLPLSWYEKALAKLSK